MAEYRDLKYDVFSARLSKEVIEEFKKRRDNFPSWNLLFRDLLKDKNGNK